MAHMAAIGPGITLLDSTRQVGEVFPTLRGFTELISPSYSPYLTYKCCGNQLHTATLATTNSGGYHVTLRAPSLLVHLPLLGLLLVPGNLLSLLALHLSH